MGVQLRSECAPGNKVKISLNTVVDNSSMYINVMNADGFVKVYSGPYRVSGVETLTQILITLSNLLAIVCFPKGFLSWMIGGVSSMTLASHVSCSTKYAYSSNYETGIVEKTK